MSLAANPTAIIQASYGSAWTNFCLFSILSSFFYGSESEGYLNQQGIAIGFQTAINQSTAGGNGELARQFHGHNDSK